MVIKCRGCLRKFKLDEKRLRPQGSRVRCSRCGETFRVFPTENGKPQKPAAGFDRDEGGAVQRRYADADPEKRRYPRISVSIPSYCCNIDSDGTPLDLQIGVIKEIGQEGLAMELFGSPAAEAVSVSFIGDRNQDVQIRCRVAHSKANSPGKVRLGLSMLGSPGEIHNFLMQAVRAHHQSCLDERTPGEREDAMQGDK